MKTYKILIVTALLSFLSKAAMAQNGAEVTEASEIISRYNSGFNGLTYLVIGVVLAFILVLFFMIDIVKTVNALKRKHQETLPETERVKHSSWFQLFVLKGAKKDSLEGAHEYDGIIEYDNNPPAWFNVLFYG